MNFKRIILAKAFSPSSVNLTRKVNRHQLFGYLLSFQILFVVAIVVVVIKLAPRFFSPFPSRRGYKITQNDAEKPHFHKYWCHHLVTPPPPPSPCIKLNLRVTGSAVFFVIAKSAFPCFSLDSKCLQNLQHWILPGCIWIVRKSVNQSATSTHQNLAR